MVKKVRTLRTFFVLNLQSPMQNQFHKPAYVPTVDKLKNLKLNYFSFSDTVVPPYETGISQILIYFSSQYSFCKGL